MFWLSVMGLFPIWLTAGFLVSRLPRLHPARLAELPFYARVTGLTLAFPVSIALLYPFMVQAGARANFAAREMSPAAWGWLAVGGALFVAGQMVGLAFGLSILTRPNPAAREPSNEKSDSASISNGSPLP
ncbi:MAG: hypothetical protein SFX74_02995 [Fimbriimonadaceae bacterium]|nr:hypothetical protein [Fimbriimonadaceae bacterium]